MNEVSNFYDFDAAQRQQKTALVLDGLIQQLNTVDIQTLTLEEKTQLKASVFQDIENLEAAKNEDLYLDDLRTMITTVVFPHFNL